MTRTVYAHLGLGLRHSHDPNDRRFLASVPPDLPPRLVRWRHGPILDQGQTSRCVEYAAKTMLMAEPYQHSSAVISRLLLDLYEQAQENDEWPGSDYDGTSTRGAMKALQQRSLVTNYWWIVSEPQLRRYVTSLSPVMCGFTWLTKMFTPDSQGILTCEGGEEGGHEVCCLWFDARRNLYQFQNSWGESWGKRGLFYMRPEDVALQFEHLSGEATVAPEVRLA